MVTGISRCEKCGTSFKWRICNYQPNPKHCSSKCKFKWKNATKEEKLKRATVFYERHVIKKEGCWDWNGPIDNYGYAKMTIRTGVGFNTAHRTSWIIHKGSIPKGKSICHSCDNRKCSNPDHLWLGTPKENTQDMILKGRYKENLRNQLGTKNPSSKVSEKIVCEIKKMHKNGIKGAEIARFFKVSANLVYDILLGKTWKHVKEIA